MKRAVDLVLAMTIIALCLLPLSFLVMIVRLTSPGDGLFVHTRVGKDGKPFKMYKIRTMQSDAEVRLFDLVDSSTPLFKVPDDPRVTRLGRVLRKLSLDELPQLFNVLKGDMSLVGPRPQVAEEVALYRPEHLRRLAVRPGMTGLWQISGRSDLDFEQAVELDLAYVERQSIWLDLCIMFKTVFVLTKGAY